MPDYESVPYTGYPIQSAQPRRLAWTSFVFGGPRPVLERARVLEIGCGDGAHLLSVAAFEPGWTLLGVDTSRHGLGLARDGAARCGLTNVTFAEADIASAALEPGVWDFVVAHGVYSWVDPDRRAALRRLVRRALAPSGLACISFNALPGWGVRGRIRDILLRGGGEDPRALIERLLPLQSQHPWGRMLAHELELARSARHDYFMHEYLEEHNEAFWVGDFARAAAEDGLAWVGDSQFDLAAGRTIEAAKAAIGVAGLRGEELADLVSYCQLRSVVLARDDAPRKPPVSEPDLLESAWVSGEVKPTGDEIRLDAACEETMRSPEGLDILVREPLCKMALLELAEIYPDGLRPADLAARAREALAGHGVTPAPEEETALRDGILRLWRAGALDLRLHRESLRREAPARPAISAFTRYEASARPALSTPLGTLLHLTEEERAAVLRVDGHQPADAAIVATLARWGLVDEAS